MFTRDATRQVGAVLGSGAVAVRIDARLAAEGLVFSASEGAGSGSVLPAAVLGSASSPRWRSRR